jgi:hypothetical protein
MLRSRDHPPITWTKEKIERQRTFDDFASELREATDGMRDLFNSEMGNRRQTFGKRPVREQTAVSQ